MFKRTKGYLLLTMLVVTGLAGRYHMDTLSGKERRSLVQELKQSRASFTSTFRYLSKKQLDFHKIKGPSVRYYVYQAVQTEHVFWSYSKKCLEEVGTNRTNILPDDSLQFLVQEAASGKLKFTITQFKTLEAAFSQFKKDRADQLLYVNTTTENVRIHALQTSIGKLDAYQLLLLSGLSISHYARLIDQLKSDPHFPKS